MSLQWRHCISNHQLHDCLLNHVFRHRSKKTSKFRVTGLCEGNSLVTGEFPAQMASNAENISIWWSHYVLSFLHYWHYLNHPSQSACNIDVSCFPRCYPEQPFEKTVRLLVIWDAIRLIIIMVSSLLLIHSKNQQSWNISKELTMVVDALTLCVIRASAAILLTVHVKFSLSYMIEGANSLLKNILCFLN